MGTGRAYGTGVKWIVKPPALSPAPLDRNAFCAFVFRTIQGIQRDQEQIKVDAAAEAYARAEKEKERDRESLVEWREMVHRFEAATGLSVRLEFRDPAKAQKLGAAIRMLTSDKSQLSTLRRSLEFQASMLESEASRICERSTSLLDGLAATEAGQTAEPIVGPSSSSQYQEFMSDSHV
jgi:hypothetical protein